MGRFTSASVGLGFALFLRSGMTAWMEAWSACAGNVEPEARFRARADESIPVDLRSQLTTLLAGMILSLPQEATL